jgi:hypothetical protein
MHHIGCKAALNLIWFRIHPPHLLTGRQQGGGSVL